MFSQAGRIGEIHGRGRRPANLALVALMVALLGVTVRPALAAPPGQATALTISNATLRVSPEYDDPGVLIIFFGSFANIPKYPQPVSFPLPTGARGVQATEQDPSGSLISRQWQRQGDQATYSLEEGPAFQYEYYLDRQPSGNDRVIDYTFHAPYAVAALTIMVQQPSGATDFTLTPKADVTIQAGDGLTTYQINRTNVAAGEDIHLTARYTRTTQTPSFNRDQTTGQAAATSTAVASASGAQTSGPAQAPASNTPPLAAYILIAVGAAALAAAAVYWFLEQRRSQAPARSAGRGARARPAAMSRRPAPASLAADGAGDGARFCRKCGREYAPGDRFCGKCGTPRGNG